MADVFISYSKADHALALKLSAFLEAEGWSVWWDKSLGAADLYRDEIMKQLAAARAVITIWTENSIKSDWVRAEAGTAKAQGKLIPVKTSDVAYADIPLPFGEMHTENVGSTELIRAAVIAQLARPVVEPSAVALLAKGLKWELLTWWGIIGGAVTLFSVYSAARTLAPWARMLVEHWKGWTHTLWVWAFGWMGIRLPPEWTPVLSFLLFCSLLTVGQAVQFHRTITNQSPYMYDGKAFELFSWRTLLCFILLSAAYLWPTYILTSIPKNQLSLSVALMVITWIIAPQIILVLFARHRLHSAVSILLMFIFYLIIALDQLSELSGKMDVGTVIAGSILLASFSPLILLSVAPAKAISRRLIFLALGLLLLIALNELSKLALDLTAPKLQG
jgi:hypothetical protein